MAQHGPRTVSRHFAFAAICIVMAARLSFGQTAAGHTATKSDDAAAAAFDVVSVKPVDPDAKITMVGIEYAPDGIHASHVPVAMLIRVAYGGFMKLPTEDSVSGLPDWGKTEAFDVQAKMSPEQAAEFAKLSKDDQVARLEAMMQALLADRFKLKV